MSMMGQFRLVTELELARVMKNPEEIHAVLDDADADVHTLDVEKAWHGVHMLLNGVAWGGRPPLDFIVQGGKEIGDEDVGYGPARGFPPKEVKAIATALSTITPDTLPKTFATADVYPWNGAPLDADAHRWLLDTYGELKEHLSNAAERGLALIVYLT